MRYLVKGAVLDNWPFWSGYAGWQDAKEPVKSNETGGPDRALCRWCDGADGSRACRGKQKHGSVLRSSPARWKLTRATLLADAKAAVDGPLPEKCRSSAC